MQAPQSILQVLFPLLIRPMTKSTSGKKTEEAYIYYQHLNSTLTIRAFCWWSSTTRMLIFKVKKDTIIISYFVLEYSFLYLLVILYVFFTISAMARGCKTCDTCIFQAEFEHRYLDITHSIFAFLEDLILWLAEFNLQGQYVHGTCVHIHKLMNTMHAHTRSATVYTFYYTWYFVCFCIGI